MIRSTRFRVFIELLNERWTWKQRRKHGMTAKPPDSIARYHAYLKTGDWP